MSAANQLIPIQPSAVQLKFFQTIKDLPENEWNKLIPEHEFYAKTKFLSIVERELKEEITPYYVLAYSGMNPVAAFYFQKINFRLGTVMSNIADDKKGVRASLVKGIFQLIRNYKLPLIQTGNLFFTGDSGIFFRQDISTDFRDKILHSCMHSEEWKVLAPECSKAFMLGNLFSEDPVVAEQYPDFHAFDTEPDLWMDIHPDWNCMDDYFAEFSSKYRVRAKKVLEKASMVRMEEMTVEDILENESQIVELYAQVASKAGFNMGHLKVGYFSSMKLAYGDHFKVKKYLLNNELLGFTSTFCEASVFHVHYIGLNYKAIQDIPLYNRMLLESVKDAIDARCSSMHFGRTATEIKTTIGAKPKAMQSRLKLNISLLNCLLPALLKNFKTAPYIVRNPFRNTSELN